MRGGLPRVEGLRTLDVTLFAASPTDLTAVLRDGLARAGARTPFHPSSANETIIDGRPEPLVEQESRP